MEDREIFKYSLSVDISTDDNCVCIPRTLTRQRKLIKRQYIHSFTCRIWEEKFNFKYNIDSDARAASV